MNNYIMALDQGTTSSRCIIFNNKSEIVSVAQKELRQNYPESGWVLHNPEEIWDSIQEVICLAMKQKCISIEEINSIGITNQRETTILWDRETGEPVYSAIVWQSRQSEGICKRLKEDGYSNIIREKTGLIIDPYFSGTKVKWIFDNVSGVKEKAEKNELCFGTVDSWLLWKLTGGKEHKTDYTNASRTMLFNIHSKEFDKEILEILSIPKGILPTVCDSSSLFGVVENTFLNRELKEVFNNKPVVITGVAGDQQAALFGQCCFEEGTLKNTYGTGCFLLMNTGDKAITSTSNLVTTLACNKEGKPCYALEGSVFIGGAVVQWLRDEMELIEESSDTYDYAISVDDTNGVYIVPAFSGMGAPYWDSDARGIIVGITRGTKKAHIIRSGLEAIAYQSEDIINAMVKDTGAEIRELKVDGGATANNFLMKFQADISEKTVVRPKCIETTALGAAYLAGLQTGFWKNSEELQESWRMDKKFLPEMCLEQREKLINGWKKAISRARSTN